MSLLKNSRHCDVRAEDDTDDAKEPAKPVGVEENDKDTVAIDVSNSKKIQVNNLVRR